MAKAKKKKFAVISRSAPYGSNRPQLCLDIALAAAVFEQEVRFIFLQDGVFQLLKHQNAEAINSKSLGGAMETLELYGIEKVYVLERDIRERGLSETDLVIPVDLCSSEKLAEQLNSADCVFNL